MGGTCTWPEKANGTKVTTENGHGIHIHVKLTPHL